MPDREAVSAMGSADALAKMVKSLYASGEEAYWLSPVVLQRDGKPIGRIQAGDSVIFCCRRGEREVQLTEAFTEADFKGFARERLNPLTFVSLVQYHPKFSGLPTAFPSAPVSETIGEVVSRAGFGQLRLTETEKFAHVTYFLNGKRAEPFPGERDISVPSSLGDPLQALPPLLKIFCKESGRDGRNLAVINLASGDLMGHSDDFARKVRCAQAVDGALSTLLETARKRGYWVAVTADHGLLEDHGPTEGPVNTSHTTNPVPFVMLPPKGRRLSLEGAGTLADVAPTILTLLGVPVPSSMTGHCLALNHAWTADTLLLVILDGWGIGVHEHANPIDDGRTPTWDTLQSLSMARLEASGSAVGLLPGVKGNSESGHLTIGAGRPVVQDDMRIDTALRDGTFAKNEAFLGAMDDVNARGAALHLIGLLSRTSSHGSIEYVLELARLAQVRGIVPVFAHLITDGRSSRSERVPGDLRKIASELDAIGRGSVVTLIGRGLALDRGGDYEGKTRPAYNALVSGEGIPVSLE